MAMNLEKKVTKAMKFGAVADYFAQMDADMVIGSASVKSGSDMVRVDITAEMVVEAMKHEIGLLTKKNADSGALTKEAVSGLYNVKVEDVDIIPYDIVDSIKVTIPRATISGALDDTDIYGCQQQVPLANLMIP